MAFPIGAVVGDRYTLANTQYEFNGKAWDVVGTISGNAVDVLDSRITTVENTLPSKLDTTNLLTEMKAVDGTGSGLDADLVQGVTKNLLGIGGDGYAWVDETANRAVGVTYTNTTGKPIMVSIGASITGTTPFEEQLHIDGVVAVIVNQSGGHDLRISPMVAIVPAGSTYTYVEITTTADIGYWAELK